jgi:alkylation response protein AidB-like acyl-CoA dehydrogenase
MEFSWTETQAELYAKALSFAHAKLNDSIIEIEKQHQFPREKWQLCAEFGLLGLCVPELYAGIGLDALTTACVVEAFGRGCEDTGLLFSAAAHLFACVMPILKYGNNRVKDRLLPGLCKGTLIGANAITEAEAGSDIFAMKSQAVLKGDHYLLSGNKSYVTNGSIADVFIVYAMTNPAHGYMGMSGFVVERDTKGLSIGQPFTKMGLKTSPMCSIYLEDCVVPRENILATEGEGEKIFRDSMQWERSCLFAAYVGAMERQLDKATDYARQRRQFRKPIGKNQAISHRIVNMKMRLESARLLLYRACWLLDQGKEAGLEISMAKLAISEAAIQSGLDLIQIFGGSGIIDEMGIERELRNAIPSTIFSGTSEIQRDIIAAKLGL